MERVNPIRMTMKESGEVYELDFSREAVKFAENRGFEPGDVTRFPATKVPELWFYAFRMHHKSMSKQQTDRLLEKMGGMTPEILERLLMLYAQAAQSNNLQDAEDFEKNAWATVEM